MHVNFPVVLLTAVIPMVIGAIWYNPAVLGKMWMKHSGVTPEMVKTGNMAVIFGVSFFFSFLIAFSLQFMVIHQWHLFSIVAAEDMQPGSPASQWLDSAMNSYGQNFRTFKHGAFHGTLVGMLTAMPLIGVLALFERKSFKYILIHGLYWTICTALMGGVLCAFS
ncbi:MAG: DUF1761 domain-containing protein [Bacteroidia bacterium]